MSMAFHIKIKYFPIQNRLIEISHAYLLPTSTCMRLVALEFLIFLFLSFVSHNQPLLVQSV